ncbi:hypothetical protein TBLA_0B09070 [Henningerozyma blattae CBS 6284]|uniref:Mediator of RNA polymerase II transcription subunit 11 n=1 Tax=Henningerozyma blattae (strain ATCC 34711 / CBS 6284 / DSM 70876 / NBRC 10599 / NRRL Y-10934 / UCD 77-7) TaxID=1071380 RepID=I2H020_HENB6|nr:hypothetical protein TBLA_0B09070 [Tetrapisispora blattae CBS 6284]CCH59722.1 hypothetical protein TBLA_0B09070 [Tetrapisispora blattae CBS 6284]
MQPKNVQERLESLNAIDARLCAMTDRAAEVVTTFSELKRGNESLKPTFQQNIKNFYADLQEISRQLHEELRVLDENIGTTLLPIVVKKKALGQDDDKLREQLSLLEEVLEENKETGSLAA